METVYQDIVLNGYTTIETGHTIHENPYTITSATTTINSNSGEYISTTSSGYSVLNPAGTGTIEIGENSENEDDEDEEFTEEDYEKGNKIQNFLETIEDIVWNKSEKFSSKDLEKILEEAKNFLISKLEEHIEKKEEENLHEGMIHNPITGKWSWL